MNSVAQNPECSIHSIVILHFKTKWHHVYYSLQCKGKWFSYQSVYEQIVHECCKSSISLYLHTIIMPLLFVKTISKTCLMRMSFSYYFAESSCNHAETYIAEHSSSSWMVHVLSSETILSNFLS